LEIRSSYELLTFSSLRHYALGIICLLKAVLILLWGRETPI
jgi:hypothetical protein